MCVRIGSLPVDYDRSLFDDAVIPNHDWPRVSKDDNLRVHDSTCVGRSNMNLDRIQFIACPTLADRDLAAQLDVCTGNRL